MDPLFFILLCSIIIGGICSHIAKKRNRHPFSWFIFGTLFGAIALIVLIFLPARKPADMEPVHSTPISEGQNKMTPPEISSSSSVEPAQPAVAQKLWYYLDENDQQYGPMSFDALRRAWREDQITGSTYVWNEEMENWKILEELPDILDNIQRE
jgi:hypothetical protein